VDLTRPLSDAGRDQIKAAILTYKVVFFRDQFLDQDQHAAFARHFGPLYTPPAAPRPLPGRPPAAWMWQPCRPGNVVATSMRAGWTLGKRSGDQSGDH
jgi:alpha-ketoglutarate-dependent taurine dioxygenase